MRRPPRGCRPSLLHKGRSPEGNGPFRRSSYLATRAESTSPRVSVVRRSVTAAAAAAAAESASAAAAAAGRPGLSFVDLEVAALEVLAVEAFDSLDGLFPVRHLDEAEPARLAAHLVGDDGRPVSYTHLTLPTNREV